MSIEHGVSLFNEFGFDRRRQPVSFVETEYVTPGVTCDVYTFVGDTTKDLGIIYIAPGCKTPLQRVLEGEKTIEGYISGKGRLTVTRLNGEKEIFDVGGEFHKELLVTVMIGDSMQWEADEKSSLIAYEICFPPYQDGRYENIG